jgi:glycosyltransferase involved in cell wall biosynthesis
MQLIFVNRFFYPDHSATSQLLSDLAFGLAKRGETVTVITSRLRYDAPDEPLPARETIDGVNVERVWTSRFGRRRLLLRLFDYLTFYLSAMLMLLRLGKRGAIVIAMTDPPMLHALLAPITKLRGGQQINWLQDVFPEVAEALGVGHRFAFAFPVLRWIRNTALRRAKLNVVLGDIMAGRLEQVGVDPSRIRVLPNWADCEAIHPIAPDANTFRSAWNLSGNFVVGYSGNLGRAHDIETLLTAIRMLESEGSESGPAPSIRWLFIGGGALFDEMKRETAKRGLKSVTFQPYQPRERLSESLSVADVHLVSLRPELEGLIVPSKFYGVAAAGRPTIFIGSGDGELARLIARSCSGVQVNMGNGPALAAAIQALAKNRDGCRQMGERARALCEARFSKKASIEAWQDLLTEIARPNFKAKALAVSGPQ